MRSSVVSVILLKEGGIQVSMEVLQTVHCDRRSTWIAPQQADW